MIPTEISRRYHSEFKKSLILITSPFPSCMIKYFYVVPYFVLSCRIETMIRRYDSPYTISVHNDRSHKFLGVRGSLFLFFIDGHRTVVLVSHPLSVNKYLTKVVTK